MSALMRSRKVAVAREVELHAVCKEKVSGLSSIDEADLDSTLPQRPESLIQYVRIVVKWMFGSQACMLVNASGFEPARG